MQLIDQSRKDIPTKKASGIPEAEKENPGLQNNPGVIYYCISSILRVLA